MSIVTSPLVFDESISQYEIHAHKLYNLKTFNNNDEVRIAIQQQDICLLPSKSSLYACGRAVKTTIANAPPERTSLVNYSILHKFREIRHKLNNVEIDCSKDVGVTSLMKTVVSFIPNQSNFLQIHHGLALET